MKSFILNTVKTFLMGQEDLEGPLLIGLSGGEDSTALLSVLLECRRFFSLNLQIAHFDHAWRVESSEEARSLRQIAEGFSLPFHTKRSSGGRGSFSNLEDRARQERFLFFEEVYRKVNARALLLAHQQEDHAETVLKRVLEGAGVLSLGGMHETSSYKGLHIWRPFLTVSRKEIKAWNQKEGKKAFQDSTNADVRFLRPRMRKEIFPRLEGVFGKNVQKSLAHVGREISLLKQYMEKRLDPYLSHCKKGKFGSHLPVMDLGIEDPFERQELIRLFLKKNGVVPNRDTLKTVQNLLEERRSNKQIKTPEGTLFVERGNIIWFKEVPQPFQEKRVLDLKSPYIQQGDWSWQVEKVESSLAETCLLSCVLEGTYSYGINPSSSLFLCPYDQLSAEQKKRVSGFLAKNKIPSQLKKTIPFITTENGMVLLINKTELSVNTGEKITFFNFILKKLSN